MLTAKFPVAERERRRVLRERSIGSGQNVAIAMSSWSGASPLQRLVTSAFSRALAGDSKLPQAIRDIEGMSGQVYRSFINNLIERHPDARYLEIGSWAGSTATAALYGNRAKCVCIDNWSQFGGPKEAFFVNIAKVRSDAIDFSFIEQDFRSVDFNSLGAFNIYMFDGPHNERDQYDGIMLAQPALDRSHILIVDDWNWEQVRDGTLRALVDTNCAIESWIEVRTTFDNSHPKVAFRGSDWHNGYFIAAIEKRQ
jgi:methyltransferase family protein